MARQETFFSAQEAARLLVKIHSEFGCNWHLQDTPQSLYQTAAAKAKPASVAAPAPIKAEAPKRPPETQMSEAVLGAIEAEKLAEAAAQKAQSPTELRAALATFKGCESLSNTATQLVFSDGVEAAGIMIIGEAPGAEEDRQGKPFVGASGQLLDYMLSFIGLDRSKNFYITNTVFWRPAGNRIPTDSEMNICAPFVKRHIELQKPKILLLVGNTSVKRFFKSTSGITKLRGSWGEYIVGDGEGGDEAIPMLATFHPAYLLRNPAAKRDVWQDLRSFKTRLDELAIQCD